MKKNDILEVTIIEENHLGNGIAKKDDITIFVPKAVTGDIVRIKIEKITKKIAIASVLSNVNNKIITTNCPYYNECGGCDLLHLSYDKEKELKENYIKKLFKDFNNSIISFDRFFYRNKVTLHVQNNRLGFYARKTNKLVMVNSCLLLEKEINNIIPALNEMDLSTVEEIKVKKADNGLLVSITGNLAKSDLKKLIKNEKIESIYQNNKLIYNEKYLKIKLNKTTYNINNDSFFQINKKCTEALYNQIKYYVGNCNNLLDLYCGTGSIGIYLHENVKAITGIEINKDSVKCAKQNIKDNNINNYEIICKDASKINKDYDVVVVDPPRSGLSKQVIIKLNNMKSKKIIYISCNPSTLKRDIELLKNYKLKEIKIFNMFPATKHIECISKLCLKDDNKKYNLKGEIS